MKGMKDKIISGVGLLLIAAITAADIVACSPAKLEYKVDAHDTPVVMTINGDQIHANEYATYLLAVKSQIESQYSAYGMDTEDLWSNPDAVAMLKQQAEQMLEEYHAFIHDFDDLGLKFTRADVKEMNDNYQSLLTQVGGEEQLQVMLQNVGYTEEMYHNFMTISMYAKRLESYYFGKTGAYNASEADILKKFNEEYICAKHVLISTVDSTTGNALTGAKLAEKEKTAQEVLQKAKSGSDFDKLIEQYGEDPGMKNYPSGYIFKEGDMVEAFYNGAKALKAGEISGVIQSDYGYHIIQRMPLDASHLDDTDSQGSTYRSLLSKEITGKDFGTLVEDLLTKVKITRVDAEISKITLDNAASIAATGSKTASTTATTQSSGASSTPSTNAANAENAAS